MPRLVCLLLALCVALVSSQRREEDLQSLLEDADVKVAPRVGSASNDDDFEVEFVYPREGGTSKGAGSVSHRPVKRRWGIHDSETRVGRLFSLPVPDDAFEGDVKAYQFDLPGWLSFSSHRGVLEGVPFPEDVGTHYISVQAQGYDGASARDFFSIAVDNISVASLLKEARCSPKQDLTVMTIVLEKPSSLLKPGGKVQLIRTLARLITVKAKHITLNSSPTAIDPLTEYGIVMAGPGKVSPRHAPSPSDSTRGQLLLQWSVGCEGEVDKEGREIVENVNKLSRLGKIEDAIDIPVVGWMVTQVNPKTRRIRRNVDYSGDYDDDDDYDYENNPIFKIARNELPKLATPVLPDPPATVYHGAAYSSPVLRPVPLSTPVYVPVKPTRVVVEASPTLVYKTDYRFGPESDLESSLLTHPTTSADYTTPLTSTTSEMPRPTKHDRYSITSTPSRPTVSETTEIAVQNFPPRVLNRIPKMPWIAGHVYRVQIPSDTFMDMEDGGTRNLALILKNETGEVFGRDSWIQFDPTKQEVYALPLEKHYGVYHFRLEAMDSDRSVVSDIFEVNFRQHRSSRVFYHQFTVELKLEKKYEYEFAYSLDWQVRAVEKIAALFHDTTSSINVRKISMDPVRITWTNATLSSASPTTCPTEELNRTMEVLFAGRGPEPSREAIRVFAPEFQLKRIEAEFFDRCESLLQEREHETHTGGVLYAPVPSGEREKTVKHNNSQPIMSNPIDHFKAAVGHLLRYKIPESTCYDLEEGKATNLKFTLLTQHLAPPSRHSWLQFDTANQEFFGLPLKEDVGVEEYILKCTDKGGLSMRDALVVEVVEPVDTHVPKPVLFRLTIDHDYEEFMGDPYAKARFVERIGKAFGDPEPVFVVIRSLEEGSVKVEWYNNSLQNALCPRSEVSRLRNIMTDNKGSLRPEFKNAFLPDFVLSSGVSVIPSGSCLADDTPTHPEEPDLPPPDDDDDVVSPRDEDYLVTFVAPAVIIAAMLLLAALIACCLYRRRRYGKMSMAGDRTFVSKGIPIIFAEELDDHRPDAAKSPVIMKEEKPPLPPPEYQRGSPPRATDRQRPPSGDMNPSSEDAPYHRPPPFTASNGGSRNQRPNLPPAYRKPPTYVPP